MTLHWWMHWFWVTTLLSILASSGPVSAAPQSEELQHMSTDAAPAPGARRGKALYIPRAPANASADTSAEQDADAPATDGANETLANLTTTETPPPIHPIQWTAVNVTDANATAAPAASVPVATAAPDANLTEPQNASSPWRRRNLTRPDFAKEGSAESRIVTEKPLSLETTYSLQAPRRAGGEHAGAGAGGAGAGGAGGMDAGAVAGAAFAALVLAALGGSTAFVLYRRRFLNKPQTLNDKCSNPDSSGYLDDSTVRDNSEEMYSLDNDSFLNSLEAMTIQNYWTDTVKHTKL